jgi:hypothetical protein
MKYKIELECEMYPEDEIQKSEARKDNLIDKIEFHRSELEFWERVYKYTKKTHKRKMAEISIYVSKYALEHCEKELNKLQ